VKLLLDENISRRIVPALQVAYPGTTQVVLAGLEAADDRALWAFAKTGGYVVLTKDDDFVELQSVLGYPPKMILLALGNCTNRQVTEALLRSRTDIEAALSRPDTGFVEII